MILIKCVVFSALVVALAVNIVAWRRYDNIQREQPVKETMHDGSPYTCYTDPGWQCNNTRKWYACWAIPSCLVNEGVTI